MKNKEIKKWYTAAFPDDKLGQQLKEGITFYDLFRCLDSRKDVYEFFGVGDSIIRERIFGQLAKTMDCDYDYIYNQWLQAK